QLITGYQYGDLIHWGHGREIVDAVANDPFERAWQYGLPRGRHRPCDRFALPLSLSKTTSRSAPFRPPLRTTSGSEALRPTLRSLST
ncbi:MAG TPA: hypothetical protein VNU24_01615, partial [Solirubrobacteraceae bacterium]|nr:hypothetical protein [Solirubrobacteraceae bacterium]